MAPSFARSISFPLSPSRSSSSSSSSPKSRSSSSSAAAAFHARSISLPCRSHPILAHLHAHIAAVRAWAQHQDPPPTTTTTSSAAAVGLAHLDALHAALADLLALPEAQASLSSSSSGAGAAAGDRLQLDAFLRLADAHGRFQEAVVELKRDVAEALAAVRRRDGARLASALRAQRKAGKDLARLAAAASSGGYYRPSRLGLGLASAAEVEVAGMLAEAAAATAAASAALFGAVAGMAAAASAAACSCKCKRTAAIMCRCRTRKVAAEEETKEMVVLVERLEEMEECIHAMEAGSDKVFRSLVRTRVALLNIHTHI